MPLNASEFWGRVQGYGDECWIWTGARCGRDLCYGHLAYGGRTVYSHRLAYELVIGPIPTDAVLDHLCDVKLCANPGHLRPTTHRENILRGTSWSAIASRRVTCPRGHAYDTSFPSGGRRCRRCDTAIRGANRRRAAALAGAS